MQYPSTRKIAAAVLFTLGLASQPAMAWGQFGTALVSELAQRQLTPEARAEAERLLGLIKQTELATVANWAGNLDKNPQTAALWDKTKNERFVKYGSDDCTFQLPRDCADGVCTVAAIERNAAALSDPKAPDQVRIASLLFLLHHVADAHSPLNNSFKDDKGGYDYAVTMGGKTYNLRKVWDDFLLAMSKLQLKEYADKLQPSLPAADDTTAAQWSQESCVIVRDGGIYPAVATSRKLPKGDFDNNETSTQAWNRRGETRGNDLMDNDDTNTVNQHYISTFTPVAEQRVEQASVRLATLLNKALVAGHPAP